MLSGPFALAVVLLVGWSGPADAATTFTVNRTGDAADRRLSDDVCDTSRDRGNQCTLRAAIQEANHTPGPDKINFNIRSETNVKTISVGSIGLGALPPITEAVTVDGYSQGSRTATTSDDAKPNDNPFEESTDAVIKIQLSGTEAGSRAAGLTVTAADATIRGLAINRFHGGGVVVEGSGATSNQIEGNFIGTDPSGARGLANLHGERPGVAIQGGSGNVVGGTSASARNLISGNWSGVSITGKGATNNRIEGNYVGTDASGTQKLRNELYGVVIMSAPGNVVGGAVSGAGNVISGNGEQGVLIRSSGATNNTIEGNYIGTDTTGVQDLGNGQFGVFVSTSDNTIGKGNTIAHNPSGGIRISSSRNKVKGNVIKANGGSGVDLIPNIFSPTNDNVIGGTTSADANVIHDNVGAGVQLRIFADTSSAGNSVLTNSIFANGGLGIGLNGFNFPGNNDEDDPDSGINNGQSYPVITSATRDSASGETTITGMLNSNPNQTYTIQCFKADAEVRNHGEGETFLAETTAATDANGDATFTFTTIEDALAVGDEVTSTATNTSGSAANTRIGDTSQFSRNLVVTAGP
jgi:hypothetical protein